MLSKRPKDQHHPDLSFLHLHHRRFLTPFVQGFVFDCLDNDSLTAAGSLSRTSRLFLQQYLGRRTSLTIGTDEHQLLPLAVRHCRKLARVELPASNFAPNVANLILNNTSSLEHLVAPAPISDPSIFGALVECPRLRSLYVQTTSRGPHDLVEAIVSQCRQLESLRFGPLEDMSLRKVLNQAPPGLLELSAPYIEAPELQIAASRFRHLQTLHVKLETVQDYVPALRLMNSLVDLSITLHEDAPDGLEGDAAVIQSFLRARGYHNPEWNEPEPDRQIEVIEMPNLRKLRLDEYCTSVFVVKSEALEDASVSVFWEVGLALEMLRHSSALCKISIGIEPDLAIPSESDAKVFVEACRRWSQLEQIKSDSVFNGRMLSALAKYCPRLESIEGWLGMCTEDSVLALLALPHLSSVQWNTFDLEIPELDQPEVKAMEEEKDEEEGKHEKEWKGEQLDELEFKLPPIVHSEVQLLVLEGGFHQRLVDRLRCPRLHCLSLSSHLTPSVLRLDSLLDSAADSLASLHCHDLSNPPNQAHLDAQRFVSSSFDWSRFTSLKDVGLRLQRQTSFQDLIALVRDAPHLGYLHTYLRSPTELVRVFNAVRNNSTLRSLVIGRSKQDEKTWPPGSLDFILPSLLHPDRRPPALQLLTVPPYLLSPTVRSQFPLHVREKDTSIVVQAYRPA